MFVTFVHLSYSCHNKRSWTHQFWCINTRIWDNKNQMSNASDGGPVDAKYLVYIDLIPNQHVFTNNQRAEFLTCLELYTFNQVSVFIQNPSQQILWMIQDLYNFDINWWTRYFALMECLTLTFLIGNNRRHTEVYFETTWVLSMGHTSCYNWFDAFWGFVSFTRLSCLCHNKRGCGHQLWCVNTHIWGHWTQLVNISDRGLVNAKYLVNHLIWNLVPNQHMLTNDQRTIFLTCLGLCTYDQVSVSI
jgi:hypothetical protein